MYRAKNEVAEVDRRVNRNEKIRFVWLFGAGQKSKRDGTPEPVQGYPTRGRVRCVRVRYHRQFAWGWVPSASNHHTHDSSLLLYFRPFPPKSSARATGKRRNRWPSVFTEPCPPALRRSSQLALHRTTSQWWRLTKTRTVPTPSVGR